MPNDTALKSFTINAKSRSFQLDAQGKGVCTFIVANSGKAALEGRVRLTPTGQNPAVVEWLAIAEPTEQTYKPNEERSYSIAISVPPDAPGGTYLFRAEAYSVANPNDDYVSGPEFSFTVAREAPGVKKPFPLWIPFTGLALVVAVIALVAVLTMGGGAADGPTTVPALVGKDEAEATRLLVDAHLAVGDLERKPTADAPAGQIIAQSPEAGGEAPSGTVVSLVVAAEMGTPTAAVPTLTGHPLEEAKRLLLEAKLKPGVVGEDDDGAGAPGTVLKQSPAAGETIGQGSEVSLVVKAKPAPSGPAPIAWEGIMRVRQTWFGDVDGAKECDAATRKDADFWFRAETASERFLDAQNGAAFGFPSEPTLASCREAVAVAPVTRIALASLKADKLIAVRTSLGRYALVTLAHEVGASPATLELRYLRFILRVLPVRPTIDLRNLKTLPLKPTAEIRTLPAAEAVRPATVLKPALEPKAETKPATAPRLRNEAIR
jgi:hypothetical protein